MILTRWGERPRRGSLYRAALRARVSETSTLGGRRSASVRYGPFKSGWTKPWAATVVEVKRLTPTRPSSRSSCAPPCRRASSAPASSTRVHNLEHLAPTVEGTALASEGLALTGAWVDKERGLISLIALEMGSSSRLCALWKPGDPLVVMGVTGTPTDIPSGKTVMLLGGGLERRAVLDRKGVARRGQSGDLLRRLSQPAGRLQGRRGRGGLGRISCGRWTRSRVQSPSR